jgi:hypothetical protein
MDLQEILRESTSSEADAHRQTGFHDRQLDEPDITLARRPYGLAILFNYTCSRRTPAGTLKFEFTKEHSEHTLIEYRDWIAERITELQDPDYEPYPGENIACSLRRFQRNIKRCQQALVLLDRVKAQIHILEQADLLDQSLSIDNSNSAMPESPSSVFRTVFVGLHS